MNDMYNVLTSDINKSNLKIQKGARAICKQQPMKALVLLNFNMQGFAKFLCEAESIYMW